MVGMAEIGRGVEHVAEEPQANDGVGEPVGIEECKSKCMVYTE
jgi:hypothetical protein